jgi:hypothetical protein
MARIASTTSAGVDLGPTGGMTLDALMARAKAQAELQQQAMAPRVIQSPWQGAAQMAQSFLAGHRERQAEQQLAQGRAALAQIMGGVDPTTGANSQQLGQAYQLDPDLGLKLMDQAIQARREASQLQMHNTERAQDRQWHVDDMANQQNFQLGLKDKEIEAQRMPKLSDVAAVRQDVISDPSYKNMAQAVPIWTSMQDAATRDTPQADLNMVIGLAKLFDPTSVVRQSESGAVELTGNYPTQLEAQFKYLTGTPGSRLAPEVRQGMLQEGWSRVKGYADAYGKTSDFYSKLATESGIPVERVVPTFGDLKPYEAPTDPNLSQPPPDLAPQQPAAGKAPAPAAAIPSSAADDMATFSKLPPGSQYTVPGQNGPDGKPLVFQKRAPAAPGGP